MVLYAELVPLHHPQLRNNLKYPQFQSSYLLVIILFQSFRYESVAAISVLLYQSSVFLITEQGTPQGTQLLNYSLDVSVHPAAGQLDTRFLVFLCLHGTAEMVPKFRVATACFSCSSPLPNKLIKIELSVLDEIKVPSQLNQLAVHQMKIRGSRQQWFTIFSNENHQIYS
jgi:hypothetical protein